MSGWKSAHDRERLALEPVGRDLHRPECVLATAEGDVYVSDWRGGVTVIHADGRQQTWLGVTEDWDLRPNGIALAPDGSFLVANLGDAGGVWRLARDGRVTPVVTEVDGLEVPPANFVTVDRRGRTWVSVSTRERVRQRAWHGRHADGFVILLDDRGARVVADGLAYTNEVRLDPSGGWLYVVETFGRRLRRFPVFTDGSLGTPELVVGFGHGTFPDGFTFDEEGGIWITSLVSNRVLRLHEDRLETLVEDLNPDFVAAAEAAYASQTMTADHLGPIPGTRLQQVTSVAFGGPDRRTGFLGALHSTCIYRFRSPVAGI
jgi:sugar lactone lactonase YvrE